MEIDGSMGGGSVLRLAIPLSLALDEPICITNIRKHRRNPGIKTQHLLGIELLATITNSHLVNATVGSSEIEFYPQQKPYTSQSIQKLAENQYKMQIATAGSISLIYQGISNYLFATKIDQQLSLRISGGGTHVSWSPNFDYLSKITNPLFNNFHQNLSIYLNQPGFYPKGGANLTLDINQSKMADTPIKIHDPDKEKTEFDIDITSIATKNLKQAEVAKRQIEGALSLLSSDSRIKTISHTERYYNSKSTGTAITISCIDPPYYKGSDHLGVKGLPAESVGKKAATKFLLELDNPGVLDHHLADQVLVPLTYAPKNSSVSIPALTDHVKTNFDLINHMLGTILEIDKFDNHYIVTKT